MFKYKTIQDAINDGWSLVQTEPPGTYYSYWKKNGRVLCEDELIENWQMKESNTKRIVRTHITEL